MKPEIFMDDFERTEYSDGYHGVVGRALIIATRFEHNARAMSAIVGVKEDPGILSSGRKVQEFIGRMDKRPLAQHLKDYGMFEADLFPVLDRGRLARNYLVHEATNGLDRKLDYMDECFASELVEDIADNVRNVAEADCLICLILSVVTNEHLPNREFLEVYPVHVVHWVVDQDGSNG